jgi:serine/threonine protein kinase
MLVGQYEIIEEIGVGGMGVVYRAKDRSDCLYAIKQLKANITHPELLERFQREGEALRELNHPNIVKMLEMLEENGKHYLVLEYIQGGDLNHLIQTQTLSIETILKLAIDIADALTRAHKLKIIHRDLKPANVLLADDGTVRLTDFGVAHIGNMKQVTETGMAVGTLDYMPPEALDGKEVDTRADIWSFGVMLFEMLSGKRPFTAATVTQTVVNILTQELPYLEELRPDAPIALIDLVYRMLGKDRQSRISSIRHVGAALEDIAHGRSPMSRFDTPVPLTVSAPEA